MVKHGTNLFTEFSADLQSQVSRNRDLECFQLSFVSYLQINFSELLNRKFGKSQIVRKYFFLIKDYVVVWIQGLLIKCQGKFERAAKSVSAHCSLTTETKHF